jgi:hypothetical protein
MTRGETGKQRQTRIELKYYKRPDAIARWRARLILAAIVVAGLWFGLAPNWDRRAGAPMRLFQWDRLASPGPLVRVHSTWESSCETCHVPFQPMNDSHLSPLAKVDTRISNERCQTCHAGPTHHATQVPREAACTVCHHDHRGTDASLVRLDDAACTTCHADLQEHRDRIAPAIPPVIANSVSQFGPDPDRHPEFYAVKNQKDPGLLKFNHALHFADGYRHEPGGKILTFAMVDERERARYGWNRGMPLDTPVPALKDCNSCHRLDSDEYAPPANRSGAERAPLAARGAGAYMLPVTYENHCRACHQLQFDSKAPGRQLTHGLSPAGALDQLREFYQSQVVTAGNDLLRGFIPPRPKPGEPESPALQQVGRAVDEKVLTAVKLLFGSGVDDRAMRDQALPQGRRGCVECHHLSPSVGPLVRAEAIREVAIEPVQVPIVWFERARFDHSAHRGVQCDACHSAAAASTKSSDVLLPGINKCVECHGPADERGGETRGGAGDSCTECHRYHNGDHPLQGIGASPRGVGLDKRRTIDQFLRGIQKRQSP